MSAKGTALAEIYNPRRTKGTLLLSELVSGGRANSLHVPLKLFQFSELICADLARAGLDLHRAILADWVGKAAFQLKPIIDRLAEHLKRSGKLFMDETN